MTAMELSTAAYAYDPRHETRSAKWSPAGRCGFCLSAIICLVWLASFGGLGFKTGLAILTVIGFAAAIWGIRSPSLGLLGVGMICTNDALTRVLLLGLGGVLRWNTFSYWLLFVSLLSSPILLAKKDPHTLLMKYFVAVLAVGILVSPSPLIGTQHTFGAISMFGLFVYYVRAVKDADVWFWLGVVNGLSAAFGCLVFYLQGSSYSWINPNVAVYFPLTAIFTICLASHFSKEEPRRQLLLGVLAAVNVVWVFLSTSRGGLLVSILCLLFLMLNMPGLSRRIFFLVAAVVIGSYIVSHFAESQTRTIARVEKLIDPNLSADERTSGRYNLVLGGWLIFLDNPMGVGTGGYASSWANLNDVEAASVLSGFATGSEMAAHSAWIKTLAENGVPGFMLFAAYVFSFAYVGLKKRRQGLFLIGGLTTAVLSVAFVSTEFQAKGLWLLAAGATVILHQRPALVFDHEPVVTEADACCDAQYEENGCYR